MRIAVFGLMLPSLVHAGDHRELCDKVAASTSVVELRFSQVAVWPESHREKSWPPPARELKKTAETGTVTDVFKGSIELGTGWSQDWGVLFSISGIIHCETYSPTPWQSWATIIWLYSLSSSQYS